MKNKNYDFFEKSQRPIYISKMGKIWTNNRGIILRDPVAQCIIDSFTKHFGILKVFQLMVHFGFLADNCEKVGAVQLITDVLDTGMFPLK